MKKLFSIFIVFSICFSLQAKQLQANFSYCAFFSPDDGSYIETYLSIHGNSVVYVEDSLGNLQANVEVMLLFKQEGKIKEYRRYNVLSPLLIDTTEGMPSFIDQQRLALPNGKYMMEISLKDNNAQHQPLTANQSITINYPLDVVSISDIELIERINKTTELNVLSKSGYDLIPYVYDFFPEIMNKLTFYAEIYHIDSILKQNEPFELNCHIETFEKSIIFNNFKQTTQLTALPIHVVLKEFDLSSLPSGNYNLVIEVKKVNNNELIAKKTLFFQRSNPGYKPSIQDFSTLDYSQTFVGKITDKDTLLDYMKSIIPIASSQEINFINNQLSSFNLELAQRFFLGFWMNKNSIQPEQTWLVYQLEVEKVNNAFSTFIRKGYETDRGRIYLKYGPPNKRAERKNEPSAYPYEIWHYYKIENQSNAKFVFYDPDLGTDDYILLHSNVTGEINNYRWQLDLMRRNEVDDNLDLKKGSDHWGSQIEELYNNPR